MSIELGDRVKDKISGLSGIVTGVTTWLYGCRRLVIQPEQAKDGKPAETFCVDEPQVTLVKAMVIEGIPVLADIRHGTRPDAPARATTVR